MMKLWKMSCIIHPIHLSWYLFNTSLHGDISIGFQNKILWSSRNHEASLWEAWQVAPSAEHLVLSKGHALWRGAPSSTCLAREAYQVFQPIQLGGQFNQFNHVWFTHVTHQVLNWKPHDGDRYVWGFQNARYLHVVTLALYTTEHLPDSPALPGKSSPRRCKAYGDILSPHNLQRNGWNGLRVSPKTCLVTVLFCDLLYIQRKWTE